MHPTPHSFDDSMPGDARAVSLREPSAESSFGTAVELLGRQAIRLHALGLCTSIASGGGGRIDRHVAEQLADDCGALVEELLDAGLWYETDIGYVVRASR